MIFALIFLSVSLVLSHQQRYPAPTTTDLMYWLSHYYLPSRQAFNHYNYNYHHPVNCEAHPGYYHPFLRHFPLAKPNRQTFSQQVKIETQEPVNDAIESANGLDDENEFPDNQPRIKGFNRIRPLFQPKKKPQNDPRVVINLASPNNLFNRKVKTITFTFTSSLTFTSVQSCIPSAQFSAGSADVTCRRKRREIVESHPGIKSDDEMTQFAITPSDVQPFETTRLSSSLDLLMKEDYGQRTDDRTFNRQQVVSSKDEDEVTSSPVEYSREKRFFFHFVTTTTVINYSFSSTTVTKTVSLLNTLAFPGAYLICRPDGYTVCPYTANSFIG